MNGFWKSTIRFSQKLYAFCLGVVALAIGVISVLYAFQNKEDNLALPVAIGGTAVALAVLFMTNRWLADIRVKDKIAELDQIICATKGEGNALRRTIKELESQQINITHFNGILELALLEVQMRMQDVCLKRFSRSNVEQEHLEVEGDWEYVGLCCREFKMKLGVDLATVRVSGRAEGKEITIHGVKAKIVGHNNMKTSWPVREVRTVEKIGVIGFRENQLVVRANDSRKDGLVDEQTNTFESRLSSGLDLQSFNVGVERLARELIKELLRPMGYSIRFEEDGAPAESSGLMEFLKAHNNHIEKLIRQTERRFTVVESQAA